MAYIPKYVLNNEKTGTCTKKRLPCVLSKQQLLTILSSTDDLRLAIVIFLGIFLGLRISEIVSLKWENVNLEHGELIVLDGKNTKRYKSEYGKDRLVIINDMFIPTLKKWQLMNIKEDYVIPNENRYKNKRPETKSMIRLYQEKLTNVLKKVNLWIPNYKQKNGTARHKYHMHTLRHVCGTNLYRRGMDIYTIKEYLGHEKIETTQLYCELAKDDVRLASHRAYAYPKSSVALPELPQVEIKMDRETLQLQKEILDKQLELTKLRAPMLEVQ
jgi:integrase